MSMTSRQRGVAMLYALMLMVVIMGVATLLFARTLNEMKHSGDDAGIVQSLMLARGAANLGGAMLQDTVKSELGAIIEAHSPTTSRWAFGTGTGDYPSPQSVVSALVTNNGSVAEQLQTQIDNDLCGTSPAPTLSPSSGGTASVRIFVTDSSSCGTMPSGVNLAAAHYVSGAPRNGGSNSVQTYAIPFVLVAQGSIGGYKRNVVAQGEYQFEVGRKSFATYALFTNKHELPNNGGDVWFTEHTLFDGPVHTNQYFRFYHNPWFGGAVTSAGCSNPFNTSASSSDPSVLTCNQDSEGAQFYGVGFVNNPPPPYKYTTRYYGVQQPVFDSSTPSWNSSYVPLPSNQDQQKGEAQNGGLYIGSDTSTVKMWAASDSAGDELTKTNGTWNQAQYQYIQTCNTTAGHYTGNWWNRVWVPGTSTCTTYRYQQGGALMVSDGSGNWTQYTDPSTGVAADPFNGVIYVDGSVDRVTGPDRPSSNTTDATDTPPAVASFAQMTLATKNDMRITGDLKYEDSPCTGELSRDSNGNVTTATCNNMSATNVLGLYAQDGNVNIGNYNSDSTLNAPTNLRIDGVLMSATGVVGVENYNQGNVRGTVHLLGGVIENYYGAFGTFNASTGQDSTGYSRKFTYDPRMSQGLAPPFFPTVQGDVLGNIGVYSYGQREQVY